MPWMEAGLPGTISRISPGAAVEAEALEEAAGTADDDAERADADETLGTMAVRMMPRG